MPGVDEKVKQQRLVIERVKTKGQAFLMFAPNIFINILMVLALMFISMIDKNNEFSWGNVFAWSFLFITLLLVVIYQVTHWSAFNSRIKKLNTNEDNIDFLEAKEKEIKEVTNTVEWHNHRYAFIKDRNENEKVEAWKIHIQNKITKLTTKAKKQDTDLENETVSEFQRSNLTDDEILNVESDIHTRQDRNRYIKRKRALEEMLNDKWIAEHIKKIDLPYNEVDVNFIETGDIIKGQKKDKVDKKGKYAKDNAPTRIVTTVITIAVSIFTADLILNWSLGGWVDFVLRLALFVLNMIMGTNYADVFFTDTDLHNSKTRVKIANEFIVWCKKKNIT